MSLRLKLQPDERLVVNGCVIKNGSKTTSIEIENRADILRGKEILKEEECRTPVTRIQFKLQLALVSPDARDELVTGVLMDIDQLIGIMSTSGMSLEFLHEAKSKTTAGEFYGAFKVLEKVREREEILLSTQVSSSTKK